MFEILIALPTHPKDLSEKDDPNDRKLSRDVVSNPPLKQDLNDIAEPILISPSILSFEAYNGCERKEFVDAI
jgi:hypothetical protein